LNGFEIRRETDADADAIATLLNEAAAATGAARPPVYSGSDIRDWSKLIDRENDTWLAFAAGELAGSGWVFFRKPAVAEGGVRVGPRFRGRGLAAYLLALTEERARQREAEAIRHSAAALDRDGRRLLESAGYEPVRSFLQMSIELSGEPHDPRLPEGIELTRITPDLERPVHAAITEAFADDWGFVVRGFEEWRAHRIEGETFDPGLWIVARDGDEVAGAAVCATRGGIGYVDNLAVPPRWRRRGLGLALLHEAFSEFSRRGESRVALGVDAENSTGATRLYERAGMQVDWQDDVYEKALERSESRAD
jgi:mycothiol synthase